MHQSIPFGYYYDYFRAREMNKPYKTMEEALALVKTAVQGEREDELFYDFLLSEAPTQEEKNIIETIRNDERKHNRYFREIYSFYTGQSLPQPANNNFEKPVSYIEGIRKAKFGELGAVERYRDIRAGIPDEYYKDMVFEILTDELKHADKYDYILYLDLNNKLEDITSASMLMNPVPKNNYPTEEAMQIAQMSFFRQAKEFTLNELADYDGSMGRPAYAAVNGIVYDVSNSAEWGGGSHFGLIAGRDLTSQFQNCHPGSNILEKLPKVGILKA